MWEITNKKVLPRQRLPNHSSNTPENVPAEEETIAGVLRSNSASPTLAIITCALRTTISHKINLHAVSSICMLW